MADMHYGDFESCKDLSVEFSKSTHCFDNTGIRFIQSAEVCSSVSHIKIVTLQSLKVSLQIAIFMLCAVYKATLFSRYSILFETYR
jgi:hypothetical protein